MKEDIISTIRDIINREKWAVFSDPTFFIEEGKITNAYFADDVDESLPQTIEGKHDF